MQLHWGWAVLGALALGAALAWWMTRQDERVAHRAAPVEAHASAEASRRDADEPTTMYRWVDSHGVVNVSNTRPPAGVRYKTIRIDPNQNVVPMNATVDPSTASAAH